MLGLIIVFTFAGLIEGFVTPSSLPTEARISIGAAAFLAFWSYVLLLGPGAAARGHTGRITDGPRIEQSAAGGSLPTGPT